MAGIIEVKDQGKLRIYDADNSNYIDIVVPSTVSSNRTITLPDASFTVPTADTVGGITEIDQWRLSAGLTGDQDPIATNLERVDTDGFSHLGTGMTQSSGIFTFPSTGYWDISAHFRFSSGATDNQKTGHIVTTTDNSSYSDAASCVANFYASGALGSTSTKFIFDCTNTTTHKVRFRVGTTGGSGNSTDGDTNANFTVFTFIKLANT